ncbi:MAG: hypothetical protein LBP27_04435 [Treponema sp.]|jgi:hypothetical protein|nr:hypothetical protein [Treponema sp.]
MKKSCIVIPILLLLFITLACKSTQKQDEPPPETEQPSPAPPASPGGPSQAALNELDKARARVDEAKKRASDFEGPSYFPSDWQAVESKYADAENLPRGSEAEIRQATAAYNGAADAYDDIFNKTIPLYAQAREDEVTAVRDGLIATGLTRSFPEYLNEADQTALAAVDQYEKKDYYAARDTAALALARYQALKAGADAYLVRQEIVSRGFIPYDPGNFDRADATGQAAIDEYLADNFEPARDEAAEARLRYNQVLETGWSSYAADQGASAGVERQNALNLKANVAVRDMFNEADALYNQAAASLKAEKYEDAAVRYTNSEALFVIAGQAAAEKRRLAEEAIKEAEEKVAASDETARKAEIFIEGGAQ